MNEAAKKWPYPRDDGAEHYVLGIGLGEHNPGIRGNFQDGQHRSP